MSKLNNKKICIVASSLAKGGAEQSAALLSIMLDDLGHNVHIVTVLPEVEYNYSGKLFNLGKLKKENNSFLSRINRLLIFRKYLKEQDFDVIIDNRTRVQGYREFIITKFIYNVKVIYVIHNFETSKVFTKHRWLNKYLYRNQIMTSVSKAAKDKFEKEFGLRKITTIYNGFDFESIIKKSEEVVEDIPQRYILFYGRLDNYHKNLKLLLDAFKASDLPNKNIKLLILGDGPDYNLIVEYSKSLNLHDDVIFKGFSVNPYPYVKQALFTLLSSRFEGFPMIIPESLSLETPVISVNCQSGPNEVLKNGFNGLLVENNNVNALAEAMNSFIFDKNLYQKCRYNAKQSVVRFSIENISECWSQLLNDMIK
ncbi:glycosyltransferase [Psychroserpens sp.]